MNPRVPARLVAVGLALVLGSAVATVGVRLLGGPEQVPVTATMPSSPTPASPRPSPSTPTTPLPTPTSSAPAPTAGPSPRSTPPPVAGADLAERVLAPRGALQQVTDDEDGTGQLDAAAVAALAEGSEGDRAAAARRLEALGFEQALGGRWTACGRVYALVVHRFATPEGAEQLVSDVAARRPGPAFRSRTVPEAVAYSGHSVLYWEQDALFARGRYAYRLTYLSRQEDFRHRTFDELLRRQAAHAARLDP